MSRLLKRLKEHQLTNKEPEEYYEPEEGQYFEEADYGEEKEYPQIPETNLVREYDNLQKRASEYDKEMRAMEATNPHSLFKEVVTHPSPKGALKMRLFGRPVDLAKLENYLVFKVSPKTVTTLMRYNDAKSIEDIKGYSKKPAGKWLKSGMIWIILGAVIILIIGIVLFTQGPALGDMMKGMFGGGIK